MVEHSPPDGDLLAGRQSVRPLSLLWKGPGKSRRNYIHFAVVEHSPPDGDLLAGTQSVLPFSRWWRGQDKRRRNDTVAVAASDDFYHDFRGERRT